MSHCPPQVSTIIVATKNRKGSGLRRGWWVEVEQLPQWFLLRPHVSTHRLSRRESTTHQLLEPSGAQRRFSSVSFHICWFPHPRCLSSSWNPLKTGFVGEVTFPGPFGHERPQGCSLVVVSEGHQQEDEDGGKEVGPRAQGCSETIWSRLQLCSEDQLVESLTLVTWPANYRTAPGSVLHIRAPGVPTGVDKWVLKPWQPTWCVVFWHCTFCSSEPLSSCRCGSNVSPRVYLLET